MTTLSVVVPVFQNAGSLPMLLERLRAVAAGLGGFETELIFVDDGSTDDSFRLLSSYAERDPRVRVIGLSRNFGSNPALLAGLCEARGDLAVTIAADLQDPPELIPEMIARWQAGAQVVIAARQTRRDPWLSRLFAAVFNRLFRRLVFPDFPRQGFDFVALDREVVRALVSMPEKHSYLFGQVLWLGYRRVVLPYARETRAHGKSAWTFARKLKYFIDAFTAFSYAPLRLASVTGSLLALGGLAYAVLVIILKLRGDIAEHGFSALMVVILVVSGAQLLVLGVMGEYLWRVLEEVRTRPPYVVARKLNFDVPRRGADAGSAPEAER
jgi:polyisoprenyl-phosphate glycosyltransferase